MKPRISVFIATSLDGFIARKDGSIDWLNNANTNVPKGEDGGYHAFMASVDVLIMGRNTYEQVLTFGEWPYGEKKVIILSSRKIEFPAHLPKTVSWSSASPVQLVKTLSTQGAKRLYVDGGVTIQRFLQAGLVDEVTITLTPVILGEGKPLFFPLGKDVALTHLDTRSFFGFVQVKYAVKKEIEAIRDI